MKTDTPKLDPITAQKLLDGMKEEADKRRARNAFKPRPRIHRPWLGALNWERHKKKLADKRRAANKVARQTRRAQRRASRA